jgi:hypothetical protein
MQHGTSRAMTIRKRNAGNTDILLNTEAAYAALDGPTAPYGTGASFTANNPYQGVFEIERQTRDSVSVRLKVNGLGFSNYSHAAIDDNLPEFIFDS